MQLERCSQHAAPKHNRQEQHGACSWKLQTKVAISGQDQQEYRAQSQKRRMSLGGRYARPGADSGVAVSSSRHILIVLSASAVIRREPATRYEQRNTKMMPHNGAVAKKQAGMRAGLTQATAVQRYGCRLCKVVHCLTVDPLGRSHHIPIHPHPDQHPSKQTTDTVVTSQKSSSPTHVLHNLCCSLATWHVADQRLLLNLCSTNHSAAQHTQSLLTGRVKCTRVDGRLRLQ